MGVNTLSEFQKNMAGAMKDALKQYSIEELKKLDWCSLSPDFYIDQDKEKKAA